nr:zinc-binding dehydrogenase [Herbidospora cretacea]
MTTPEFDVVVDPVGGEARGTALSLLADMGGLIAVGSADRSPYSLDTNRLWFGNIGIVRFGVGAYLVRNPSAAAMALEAVVDGSITLDVETYPLDRAADAHARLEAGGVSGRLILTP